MKLGFIGFGEVGYEISSGLISQGLTEIYAYDALQHHVEKGEFIKERAEKAKVTLLESDSDVVDMCDIIIAVVPGAFALDAVKSIIGQMRSGKIFVDASTSLPSIKKEENRLIASTGGSFIDAALMASLSQSHYKVPILISGINCAAMIEALTPYGMNIKEITKNPGDAIAVKFVRSIYMKGIAVLGAEMLEAANILGVDKLVIDSIGNTLDGKTFEFNNNYLVVASAWHADRQVHEMNDVTKMLEDIGVEPIMTQATTKRLEILRDMDAREYFHEQRPKKWQEIAVLWDKINQSKIV
jgi:3-hydroxyisobutyrate dehydrogenase-like beta-hydroxyacid dehydrogenase